MSSLWTGDVNRLTNFIQDSMNLAGGRHDNFSHIPHEFLAASSNLWRHCLIGGFSSKAEVRPKDLSRACKYKWRIHGEKWDENLDINDISHTHEEFDITVHEFYPDQIAGLAPGLYLRRMGVIVARNLPFRRPNGLYSIQLRVRVDIRQPLHFGTHAEYGEGEEACINWLGFEYHEFPTVFCSFCHRVGHKRHDCPEIIFAQQPAQQPAQGEPYVIPPLAELFPDYRSGEDDSMDYSDSLRVHASNSPAQSEISIPDYDESITQDTASSAASSNQRKPPSEEKSESQIPRGETHLISWTSSPMKPRTLHCHFS